jgi:Protein of unknown function (DUF3397)
MNVLVNTWGVFTTVPILAFALVYVGTYYWKKSQRIAIEWSVNVTNVFLIHAVHVAYRYIWPEAIGAWFWLLFLFAGIASTLGYLQKRIRGELSYKKIGFSTWRISFVLLSVAYLCLVSTGIWVTMQGS